MNTSALDAKVTFPAWEALSRVNAPAGIDFSVIEALKSPHHVQESAVWQIIVESNWYQW